MGPVSSAAVVGGLDEHARIATGFGFLNREVEGAFEFFEMGTEVAVGDFEQLLERSEIDRVSGFKSAQRGHDPETHRLVNEGVELFHGLSLT